MATFGVSNLTGYGSQNLVDDIIYTNAQTYSPASDGTASTISLYADRNLINTGNMCFALYDSSDDSLVVKTEEVAITVTEKWYTAALTSPTKVYSSKNYYITFWFAAGIMDVWGKYVENGHKEDADTYDADYPANVTWDSDENYEYAIYCTYLPDANLSDTASASDSLTCVFTHYSTPTFLLTQQIEHEQLYILPESNGCHNDFSQFPATGNNYDKIDDPNDVPDADATYVYSDSSDTKYDLYKIFDETIVGTINYVKLFARSKSNDVAQHEDGLFKIILTDDACANIYKSDDINLTTGYSTYSNLWTENPRTSTAWTQVDIKSLQIGVECDSPWATTTKHSLILLPVENGYDNEFTLNSSGGEGGEADSSWESVNDIYNTQYVSTNDVGEKENWGFGNHTTETGTIVSVTVFMSVQVFRDATGKFSWYDTNIGDSPVYGSGFELSPSGWFDIYSETRTTNISGGAWTWDNIDDLRTGFIYFAAADPHTVRIRYCYLSIIHEVTDSSPEIRTTQMYSLIDYDHDRECVLAKPNEVSTDHSRNVKMLNFWNGEREVYDLERSGKGMILKGIEWEYSCTKMQCVRDMGLRGSDIIISNLIPDCFNGTYKIVSFGWKQVSKTPEVFEWILQLEDCEL